MKTCPSRSQNPYLVREATCWWEAADLKVNAARSAGGAMYSPMQVPNTASISPARITAQMILNLDAPAACMATSSRLPPSPPKVTKLPSNTAEGSSS